MARSKIESIVPSVTAHLVNYFRGGPEQYVDVLDETFLEILAFQVCSTLALR